MLLKPANAFEKSIVFGLAKTPPPANVDKWEVKHTVKFSDVSASIWWKKINLNVINDRTTEEHM